VSFWVSWQFYTNTPKAVWILVSKCMSTLCVKFDSGVEYLATVYVNAYLATYVLLLSIFLAPHTVTYSWSLNARGRLRGNMNLKTEGISLSRLGVSNSQGGDTALNSNEKVRIVCYFTNTWSWHRENQTNSSTLSISFRKTVESDEVKN
jgi:hypothetical protein